MIYATDLTTSQQKFIFKNFPEIFKTKTKENIFDILNGLFYLTKTGCQWKMLPVSFPKWRKVYNFFRQWTDKGIFSKMFLAINQFIRKDNAEHRHPTVAVIDSESVRQCLPQSVKGIDGAKKVKGIKRHLAVDSNGHPLSAIVTPANVHDSKAAHKLICSLTTSLSSIRYIKADLGYRGELIRLLPQLFNVEMQCVKSNFGANEFRPIDGRWVVERTFSWLSNYRRLCRNFEQHLHSAKGMMEVACAMFMLRFC